MNTEIKGKGGNSMANHFREMLILMLDTKAMFPFVASELPGIEQRNMMEASSCSMETLKELSGVIILRSDPELLKWMKQKYPYATMGDVNKERELREKLYKADTESAGREAMRNLNAFHKELDSRNIKHSSR